MKYVKRIFPLLICVLLAVAVGWYAAKRGYGWRRVVAGQMSDDQAREWGMRIARAQGLVGIVDPASIRVAEDPTLLGCGFTEFAIPVRGVNSSDQMVSLVICCGLATDSCSVRYRLP